jgi:hypothetical protein
MVLVSPYFLTIVLAAHAAMATPQALVGRCGIYLHFPPLRIECEAGVKQHGDAFKFPSSLFRLGRQTAGETLCLTPHLLMQLECQQTLHSYFQYPSPIYGDRERKVHNVGNFLACGLDE